MKLTGHSEGSLCSEMHRKLLSFSYWMLSPSDDNRDCSSDLRAVRELAADQADAASMEEQKGRRSPILQAAMDRRTSPPLATTPPAFLTR